MGKVVTLEGGRDKVASELDRQISGGEVKKGGGGGGGGGLIPRRKIAGLPPDAPVKALGTQGGKVFFLDAHGQLREFSADKLARTNILHLFGDQTDWLYRLWPKIKKEGEQYIVEDWNATHAQEQLFLACAAAGIWAPQDFVRGRGAWRLGDGGLLLHCGQHLYRSDGEWDGPGVIAPHVYPAGERSLEPAAIEPGAVAGDAAAAEMLALFETWVWMRDFDARLLLGWCGAAMMAGALKVRPLAWVTGEKGTGKSSLIGEGGIVPTLFGQGIITTANTTAAGLYQKIRHDALPVAIDEIEAKRGNAKTEAVIELARQAYSGGMVLRGGQDHDGQEFRCRSPVLFGSILIPSLLPQDLSRMALLCLRPFEAGAQPPVIDNERIRACGRAMLRRVLERWPDWDARLATWRDHLVEMGHSGRSADQFGTLLAAADLLLTDYAPDGEFMREITAQMAPDALAETQSEDSNAERCVAYAMSRQVHQLRGGEMMLVSELVAASVGKMGEDMNNPPTPQEAQRFLGRAGITVAMAQIDRDNAADGFKLVKVDRIAPTRVQRVLDGELSQEGYLAVVFATQGDGVLELFRGSDWEGVPGAYNPYAQALARVPGAVRPRQTVRIGKQASKAIVIPIEACVDLASDGVQLGNG